MRPVVLDELDAVLLLLPELEVAVEGGGNDEVGPAHVTASVDARTGDQGDTLGDCNLGHCIPVHERPVVAVRRGDVVQIQLLVLQGWGTGSAPEARHVARTTHCVASWRGQRLKLAWGQSHRRSRRRSPQRSRRGDSSLLRW